MGFMGNGGLINGTPTPMLGMDFMGRPYNPNGVGAPFISPR